MSAHQNSSAPPNPPLSHQQQLDNADANFIPQGQERTAQIETLQSYEASVPQTEDEVNQATLQREFPSIDSSLIAAIYSDSKNMSEVREMLQELTREES
jgi:hypothetical protein